MRNDCPGFSLIEMAIVLIILGILATVLIPPLVSSVKYEKRAENKDALNSLKLSIIGYAKANKEYLPSSLNGTEFPSKDIWGRDYEYKNALNGKICNDATVSTDFLKVDDAMVPNVAFALASHGRLNGAENNAEYNSTWDFSGAKHDDIYEYVTLYQLKYLLGCTK